MRVHNVLSFLIKTRHICSDLYYGSTAGFPNEMVELLLLAVENLRRSLKEHNSNLMIRFGNVENVLVDLVKEVVTH